MNEICPLVSFNGFDQSRVIWDGGMGTSQCIETCILPSLRELADELGLDQLPEEADLTHDDSLRHLGVRAIDFNERAGLYHIYGSMDEPLFDETTWKFSCRAED